MAESKSTNKEIIKQEDCNRALNIIKKLKPDVREEYLKITRIGMPNETKTRPIKVTFSTKDEVRQIIRQKSKLNKENVYIKCDLTRNQREYLKKLVNELEQRKANGEPDLIIKYILNVPKIVNSTKTPQNSKN